MRRGAWVIRYGVRQRQRKLAEFGGDQTATEKAVFQGLLNKRWCTAAQNCSTTGLGATGERPGLLRESKSLLHK